MQKKAAASNKNMRIELVHRSGHAFPAYMKGYLAKRREDSTTAPVRCEDGSLKYALRLGGLPPWLAAILGVSLNYDELVRVQEDVVAVRARAETVKCTVELHIAPAQSGQEGTVVKGVVEVEPVFKGVKLPHAPIRRLIQRRFAEERARDEAAAASATTQGS